MNTTVAEIATSPKGRNLITFLESQGLAFVSLKTLKKIGNVLMGKFECFAIHENNGGHLYVAFNYDDSKKRFLPNYQKPKDNEEPFDTEFGTVLIYRTTKFIS